MRRKISVMTRSTGEAERVIIDGGIREREKKEEEWRAGGSSAAR